MTSSTSISAPKLSYILESSDSPVAAQNNEVSWCKIQAWLVFKALKWVQYAANLRCDVLDDDTRAAALELHETARAYSRKGIFGLENLLELWAIAPLQVFDFFSKHFLLCSGIV